MNRLLTFQSCLLLFLITTIMELSMSAQEDTAYVRTYGGQYFEEGRQIIECASGGYAVIGTTGSDVANNTNFYLLRLDANLECVWSKSMGGIEVEKGTSLIEDEDQNFLLCGYTSSEGAGGYDILLVKTNSTGDELWRKTYGGADWDFGYKIIRHEDEGFWICGKTYSLGNGGSDAYLLHIDEEGGILQEWTYGDADDDEFVDVRTTSNGGVVTIFNSYNETDGKTFKVFALDSNGIMQWEFQKEPTGQEYTGHSIENYQNGFVIGGSLFTNDVESGFFVILDENGSELYYHTETPNYNYAFKKALIQNETVLLPGKTNGGGAGGYDAVIFYYAFNGTFLGAPTYGSTSNDQLFDGITNQQGDLICVGAFTSQPNNTSQVLVTRHTAIISGDYYQVIDYDGNCFTTDLGSDYLPNAHRIPVEVRYYNTLGQRLNELDLEINRLTNNPVIEQTIFQDLSSSARILFWLR